MGKKGENLPRSFERKFLHKILGPVLENGCCRRHKNSEIYKLHDEVDVVKFIQLGRLRCAHQVIRMAEVILQRKSYVLN